MASAQHFAVGGAATTSPMALHTADAAGGGGGARPEYAYVFVLYGRSCEQYFLGIVCVVWSLIKHFCVHRRVLMHTPDVPRAILDLAVTMSIFDEIIATEYIEASEVFFDNPGAHQRFGKIFTKYRVLSLDRWRFEKVLLLDSDLHVRSNLDHLFELNAPAAMQRGPRKPPKGALLERRAPVNAGVVLLQPDSRFLEQLLAEISGPSPRRLPSYNSPDADYLTEHPSYLGKWSSIPLEYNFQLEFEHLDPRAGTVMFSHRREAHFSEEGTNMPWEGVRVAHFSGMKPWSAILDEAAPLLRGLRAIGQADPALQSKLTAGIQEYAREVAALQGLCSQLQLGEGLLWREKRVERCLLNMPPEAARTRLHAALPPGGRWFEGHRPQCAIWIPPGAGLPQLGAPYDRCAPVGAYLEVAGSLGPISVGDKVFARVAGAQPAFEVVAIKEGGAASLRRSMALAPEWQTAEDASTGRPYYYNTRTLLRQWEFPNLPHNWKAVTDPDSQNIYYYDTGTNQSMWDPPEFEELEQRVEELHVESVAAERATCSDVTIWKRSFVDEDAKESLGAMRKALATAARGC